MSRKTITTVKSPPHYSGLPFVHAPRLPATEDMQVARPIMALQTVTTFFTKSITTVEIRAQVAGPTYDWDLGHKVFTFLVDHKSERQALWFTVDIWKHDLHCWKLAHDGVTYRAVGARKGCSFQWASGNSRRKTTSCKAGGSSVVTVHQQAVAYWIVPWTQETSTLQKRLHCVFVYSNRSNLR